MMASPSLHGFLLRVLLWLPICFAAWYFASILFVIPLTGLVDIALTQTFPAAVSAVARDGNAVVIITNVAADAGGRAGELLFEINPLKYGYCVPVYTALVLATPDTEAGDNHALFRWVVGMLLLTATQVFGIAAEALKIIAFQLNDEASALLGLSAGGQEALALAYQFGFLVLPPVAPIVIWVAQFQSTLAALTGWGTSLEDSP